MAAKPAQLSRDRENRATAQVQPNNPLAIRATEATTAVTAKTRQPTAFLTAIVGSPGIADRVLTFGRSRVSSRIAGRHAPMDCSEPVEAVYSNTSWADVLEGLGGLSVMRQSSDGVVTLSRFVNSDASVLRNADFDPEHRRRFDFPEAFVPSLRHSLAAIARWKRERTEGTRFAFAVREAASRTLVGGCELKPRVGRTANLSFWTYPPHRRRGMASRAVALACKIAFLEMGFECLEALTDADNVGSRKVAIRNGFKEAGVRNGRVLHVLDAKTVANRGVKDGMK
jgi:RimJ/RimL family protein N-acetyltransferase